MLFRSLAGAICDVRSDYPHAVLDRPGSVNVPRLRDKLRASSRRRETVVCGHEKDRCTLSGHESRRLEIVGVVANNDAERQRSNLKDWNLAASRKDRPIDARIQLAVQADDRPSLKDRRGAEEPAPIGQLCESNYRRDGAAREGRKHGVEPAGVRVDRELGGMFTVVSQST